MEADSDLDLRALGVALWRKKWLILIPTLLVAGADAGRGQHDHARATNPKPRSRWRGAKTCSCDRRPRKSIERAAADQEAIATQVQVLQSRDIARQVIRELKLGERPDFDPVLYGASPLGAFLSAFGLGPRPAQDVAGRAGHGGLFRAADGDGSRAFARHHDRISVEDPDLAAKVVNAIVDAYMKSSSRSEAGTDPQRQRLSRKRNRETAQDASQDGGFQGRGIPRQGQSFFGTNGIKPSNAAARRIDHAACRRARAEGRSGCRDRELIRDMLKSGKPVETNDIVNSDLLKRLVEQRVLLRAQLAEQSSTLLERHPRIQELNAQINALDAQMRGELVRAREFARERCPHRRGAGRGDQRRLDRLKKQIGGASSQDVQLRALEREAKAQRDLLESYLARYREAAARENIDSSLAEARVISRATVSNVPAFPKKLSDPPDRHARDSLPDGGFCAVIGNPETGWSACSISRALAPFEEELAPQSDPVSRPVRRSIFSVLKRSPRPRQHTRVEPQLNEQPLDEAELPTEAAGVSKSAAATGPDCRYCQGFAASRRGRTQDHSGRRRAQCRDHPYRADPGARAGGRRGQGGAVRSRA